jgi:TolA-binding protein
MNLQPNQQFADQKARNRISELEECIRTHNNRISLLESRIRQNSQNSENSANSENGPNAEEFESAKQQIASFYTAIARLNEENATRVREHQTLPSTFALVEKWHEELREVAIQRLPRLSHSLDSMTGDLL